VSPTGDVALVYGSDKRLANAPEIKRRRKLPLASVAELLPREAGAVLGKDPLWFRNILEPRLSIEEAIQFLLVQFPGATFRYLGQQPDTTFQIEVQQGEAVYRYIVDVTWEADEAAQRMGTRAGFTQADATLRGFASLILWPRPTMVQEAGATTIPPGIREAIDVLKGWLVPYRDDLGEQAELASADFDAKVTRVEQLFQEVGNEQQSTQALEQLKQTIRQLGLLLLHDVSFYHSQQLTSSFQVSMSRAGLAYALLAYAASVRRLVRTPPGSLRLTIDDLEEVIVVDQIQAQNDQGDLIEIERPQKVYQFWIEDEQRSLLVHIPALPSEFIQPNEADQDVAQRLWEAIVVLDKLRLVGLGKVAEDTCQMDAR
jgi:hypothetical protein